jgi:hypothetical protein
VKQDDDPQIGLPKLLEWLLGAFNPAPPCHHIRQWTLLMAISEQHHVMLCAYPRPVDNGVLSVLGMNAGVR